MRLFYRFIYRLTRATARLLFRFETVHAENVPREGPFLAVSTHCSFLDPPLVGGGVGREIYYLSREGILKVPGLGRLCRALNAMPIRRGVADRQAIRTCRAILKEGWPLLFFPEGTRSPDGRLGTIRSGFVTILEGAPEVPMLPIVMQDTHGALPRGAIIPRPRKVRMRIGPPMQLPPRAEGESTRDFHQRCCDQLEACWREMGAR
jgi:1-acyl-sn-glycerol-3-phosphate acyltransferase